MKKFILIVLFLIISLFTMFLFTKFSLQQMKMLAISFKNSLSRIKSPVKEKKSMPEEIKERSRKLKEKFVH